MFGPKGKIGFEFTKGFLKISVLQTVKKEKEISFLEVIPIQDLLEEEVALRIVNALKGFSIGNLEACLEVPVESVITRTLQIPSTEDNEIRDILNLQAGRQTPYSREELVIDYIKLGEQQGVYTKILVVMVPKEYIQQKNDILELAGFKLSKIIFGAEGICRWFSQKFQAETFSPARAILNIGHDSSDFSVYSEKGILFCRSIPIGAHKLLLNDQATLDKFIQEIKRSFSAYNTEDIASVPKILFVVNNFKFQEEGREKLLSELKIDIEYLQICDHFKIRELYEKILRDRSSISMTSLIAGIEMADELVLDLLPDDIKTKRRYEERAKKIIAAGSLFIIIFFSNLLNFYN